MESEEADGDVKYLIEARAAMADIRTMLGANAAQQLNVGLNVRAKLDVNLDDMDMSQLAQYQGELVKATTKLLGERGEGQEIIDVEAVDVEDGER